MNCGLAKGYLLRSRRDEQRYYRKGFQLELGQLERCGQYYDVVDSELEESWLGVFRRAVVDAWSLARLRRRLSSPFRIKFTARRVLQTGRRQSLL